MLPTPSPPNQPKCQKSLPLFPSYTQRPDRQDVTLSLLWGGGSVQVHQGTRACPGYDADAEGSLSGWCRCTHFGDTPQQDLGQCQHFKRCFHCSEVLEAHGADGESQPPHSLPCRPWPRFFMVSRLHSQSPLWVWSCLPRSCFAWTPVEFSALTSGFPLCTSPWKLPSRSPR